LVTADAFLLGGPLANLAVAFAMFSVANGLQRGWTFHDLLIAPFGQVAGACWQLLTILPGLFSQPEALSGPLGIVVEGARATQAGMAMAAAMAFSVNLSLAVLNLLPIPMLDGGQITMALVEKIFPPLVRLRVPLTLLGMLFLVGVMVYASVQDVARLMV
jgi:membrane-associated protease RseP (regulator of RpoE activity)